MMPIDDQYKAKNAYLVQAHMELFTCEDVDNYSRFGFQNRSSPKGNIF